MGDGLTPIAAKALAVNEDTASAHAPAASDWTSPSAAPVVSSNNAAAAPGGEACPVAVIGGETVPPSAG
jgi:hypothetical protein